MKFSQYLEGAIKPQGTSRRRLVCLEVLDANHLTEKSDYVALILAAISGMEGGVKVKTERSFAEVEEFIDEAVKEHASKQAYQEWEQMRRMFGLPSWVKSPIIGDLVIGGVIVLILAVAALVKAWV